MLSLYIHIPYCIKKCGYCDFLSVERPDEETVSRYIHALVTEMSLYRGMRFDSVYVGGGTPSILTPRQFARTFDCLHTCCTLKPHAECTVEANPESVHVDRVRQWKTSGVNRVSIGVQSFQNEVLELWGRCSKRMDTFNAVEILLREGLTNMNIDLILGLQAPFADGEALFKRDLKEAVELDPPHISVYILTIEGKNPLLSGGGVLEGFDDETCESLYHHTDSFLSSCGYEHYEVSNFSKKGFASRHNMNYWSKGEYIGLGAGAVSTVGGRREKNTDDIDAYIAAASRGVKPVAETELLGEHERVAEKLLLGLRTSEGLEYSQLVRFAEGGTERLEEYIRELQNLGYAAVENGRIHLTAAGFFRSNYIIGDILRFVD